MANIGSITVEVTPTVTEEAARTYLELVNWFLRGNEGWRIEPLADGNGVVWRLTDRPKTR